MYVLYVYLDSCLLSTTSLSTEAMDEATVVVVGTQFPVSPGITMISI